MRVLNANELEVVAGGDRWGDGGGSSGSPSYRPAQEPGLTGVYGIGLIGGPALRIARIIVKLL